MGITIYTKITFKILIEKISNKEKQKLSSLATAFKFMAFDKRRVITKAFIASQFSYGQLVLVFNSRNLKNKTNSLLERDLKTTCWDNIFPFHKFLKKVTPF